MNKRVVALLLSIPLLLVSIFWFTVGANYLPDQQPLAASFTINEVGSKDLASVMNLVLRVEEEDEEDAACDEENADTELSRSHYMKIEF